MSNNVTEETIELKIVIEEMENCYCGYLEDIPRCSVYTASRSQVRGALLDTIRQHFEHNRVEKNRVNLLHSPFSKTN